MLFDIRNNSISVVLFLSIYIIALLFGLLFLSSNITNAAFAGMPQRLAADGRPEPNPNIIHLSRDPNDTQGNGGLLKEVSVKLYHQGTSVPTGVDSDIALDRLAGQCAVRMRVETTGNVYGPSSANCGLIPFDVPASAWGEIINTTEGQFITATVTFVLVYDSDNPDSKIMDINHIRSFGSTRLGFVGGGEVPIDTDASDGGQYDYSLAFGTPCGQSPANSVTWRDDDVGLGPESGTISMNVTNDATGNTVGSNPNFGGKNPGSMSVNLNPGSRYNWNWGSVSKGNVISVRYPHDSGNYYLNCTQPPNSWQVGFYSYIRRLPVSNVGTQIGNPLDPDVPSASESPRPGQTFEYINDATNIGNRSISNAVWQCPTGNTGVGSRCRNHPTNNALDRWWLLTANTQDVHFSNGANLGRNVPGLLQPPPPGQTALIHSPGWVWDTLGVQASDGGRTHCVNASVWPSYGTGFQGDFEIGSSGVQTINGVNRTHTWDTPTAPGSRTLYASPLCVSVPYYYNLILDVDLDNLDAGGNTIQQGTTPSVAPIIRQDGATNGRNNTYSQSDPNKQKGLLQLLLAPGEAEPSNKSPESLSTASPQAWCLARTANNADCSTPYTSTAAVGVPGSPIGDRLSGGGLNPNTDTLPVGTKLCYASYAQHPRNIESSDVGNGDGRWSYSAIKCAIIIKSPKVQFLNTDVTVGRQSSAMAQCSENQVADAPIITTGSPANKSPLNLYGSWVEYGAFATGKITSFGSAAVPFGTSNEPRKLTFGNNGFNTTGNLGGFVYGKNCVADFFSMVKEDNTNLASLGGAVFDQSTGVLDMQQLGAGTDKTGYVARDKNILIGEATTGPSAPDTTPAPTTQSIVKINARAASDMGGNGCPKLMVKVTDSGGNVDQDTKTICATGFQDYEYVFYQDTNGPKRVETRFVNDGIVANVDRNIVLRTIDVNGQDTYVSNRASNPGSSTIGGGTNCMNAGTFYMYRSVSEGDPALNCFGILVDPVTAPLPPAQQQADYAPPEETTITMTARATLASSADGTNSVAGGCPYMYIRVTGTNGIVREHTQFVCSTSQSTYPFTVNLGGGGVASVEASYDPMDYYNGGSDRNLYVSNVRVGTTSIPINANSGANVQLKNGTGGYVAMSSAPAICKDNNTAIFVSATSNVTDGYCASVRVSNITAPVPTPTPPPSLTSGYDGFKGRSIVIYAQKTTAGACSNSSNGNITINKDLIYNKVGFASVLDIPRITIMADCNITIDKNVVDVNANLIAGDAIKTCDEKAQTLDKCNKKLVVRGAISANRLLLWRTYGADNSPGAPDPQYPAETFDLSPSQIISGYNRGIRSAKPSTVYEVDLPPRY